MIAGLLLRPSLVSSHAFGTKLRGPRAARDLSDAFLPNGSDFYDNHERSIETLVKRGQFNIVSTNPTDAQILQQAFTDMMDVVTYVQQNPNPQALARYFSPNHQAYVAAIFDTVWQMAQPGGHPRNMANYQPTDLNQLTLRRQKGAGFALAASSGWKPSALDQRIDVYNFGWGALHKRLKSDLDCDCDIKKVDYKLHFLGTLLLHETLYVTHHFFNFSQHLGTPH